MNIKNCPAKNGVSILYAHQLGSNIAAFENFLETHKEWQTLSVKNILDGDYDRNRPAMVLTFDHGYHDFIGQILSILEKYNCPATVFITSAYCLDGTGIKNDKTEFLGSADILKIAKHPLVTLGLQGKTHRRMSSLLPWALWDELTKPKKILESLTWQKFIYLAYPFGVQNYYVRLMALMAGYKAAFTHDENMFVPSKKSILKMPRIKYRND